MSRRGTFPIPSSILGLTVRKQAAACFETLRGSNATMLALVCVILIFRMAVALTLVPPWQYPDETGHVGFVRLLTEQSASVIVDQSRHLATELSDPEVEREIITSMAEHEWWRHYGVQTPDPLPTVLNHTAQPTRSAPIGGPSTYYRATALLVKILPVDGLEQQLYFQRGLSAVFGVLTVLLAWVALQPVFGGQLAGPWMRRRNPVLPSRRWPLLQCIRSFFSCPQRAVRTPSSICAVRPRGVASSDRWPVVNRHSHWLRCGSPRSSAPCPNEWPPRCCSSPPSRHS